MTKSIMKPNETVLEEEIADFTWGRRPDWSKNVQLVDNSAMEDGQLSFLKDWYFVSRSLNSFS